MARIKEIALGPQVIGSYVATILYTLEVGLGLAFFLRDRQESRRLRAAVAMVIALDTASLSCNLASVFLTTVANYGNPLYLATPHWPLITFIVCAGVSAAIVHLYMITRAWRVTQNLPVVLFLGLLATATLAGALASSAIIVLYPTPEIRGVATTTVTIWLACSSGTDVSIAATLVIKLMQVRREVTNFSQSKLRAPLKRIIRNSIETGIFTSCYAITLLILFLKVIPSVAIGLAYLLPHVYAISMFLRLALRAENPSLRPSKSVDFQTYPEMTTHVSLSRTGQIPSKIMGSGRRNSRGVKLPPQHGVRVGRTCVVRIDDGLRSGETFETVEYSPDIQFGTMSPPMEMDSPPPISFPQPVRYNEDV